MRKSTAIIFCITLIAVMFILALLLWWWDGIFVIEGILGGVGIGIGEAYPIK